MPVEGQHPNIRAFADSLAKDECGITQTEAWQKGICVECKQPALANCYSEDGRREYNISAMCEKCFDSLFSEDESEA